MDELEFVCEKCVHYEVCDRSSRLIWARLGKEKVCTDFMEVIRCKECVHWYESEGVCLKIYSDGAVSPYAWQDRNPDDFCSYGERRTDERKAD
jgi:hypothetical protein